MRYDLTKITINSLLRPISEAGNALVRLDERIARSLIGAGFIERTHFTDACASLWVDGEFVHLEDLALHDAGHDVRAPTHELTIARDVLRTRRRIVTQPVDWALSGDGLRSLRGGTVRAIDDARYRRSIAEGNMGSLANREQDNETDLDDAFGAEMAAIDAVLARSDAAIAAAKAQNRGTGADDRDPLVYEPDWDEDERLEEWRNVLRHTQEFPPVLQAAVAMDAWNELAVLQHAPWLGRLLAASVLRQFGVATGPHLPTINLGLKSISVDRRRHRDRENRLVAITQGFIAAAEAGLKEHDRLALARTMMERKLQGRRASSKLPELIDLVMARPLVSAGMVADVLDVTPQAARRIVGELGLREMTGRGRFRAWGIL